MVTKEDVIRTLRARFSDIVDGLEFVRSTRRVTGIVASEAFDGLDHTTRQNLLWKVLERAFTREDLQSIGPIAALSLREAEIKAADTD